MLIKIESIRCPYVTGLMSGCLRNCRPDTPEYAIVAKIKTTNLKLINYYNKFNFYDKYYMCKILEL